MRRVLAIVTLITLLALIMTACGGQQQTGQEVVEEEEAGGLYGGEEEVAAAEPAEAPEEPAEAAAAEAGQAEVVMQNTSFQPEQLTIQPGTTVTWTNEDSFAHTVTSGTRDSPTDLFDSGSVAAGGTFSFTFKEPGIYDYFCSIHDGYLYIGSGDGGWEGDPLEAGQDLDTLLGKILRIDVNVSEDR